MFTGWIYDALKPHAHEIKVANPMRLKAIAASKKKNDKLDAEKIADMLRCNLLPECYMASQENRELRRVLRYRNLIVRQATLMKNKISTFLMEQGVQYDENRLHGKNYFSALLGSLDYIPDSVITLLGMSREKYELFHEVQKKLVKGLCSSPFLQQRVQRLMTIPGVGEITALTWALEIDDPQRFRCVNQAVSYCGLCSAQKESAGKTKRGPLSKQRNKYLQCILIEAAKLAPRFSPTLAAVRDKERQRGNRNRATLAVARKLVAYLLAVDKRERGFSMTT
jgi:transposase